MLPDHPILSLISSSTRPYASRSRPSGSRPPLPRSRSQRPTVERSHCRPAVSATTSATCCWDKPNAMRYCRRRDGGGSRVGAVGLRSRSSSRAGFGLSVIGTESHGSNLPSSRYRKVIRRIIRDAQRQVSRLLSQIASIRRRNADNWQRSGSGRADGSTSKEPQNAGNPLQIQGISIRSGGET